MRFCPYAARIHLVLDAKNLPYHTININLNEKPEWLYHANPLGKVPVLQLTGEFKTTYIKESLLIAEYMDEIHSEKKLYPNLPLVRLQEKSWIQRFEAIATKFHQTNVDGTAQWNDIQNGLDEFEEELNDRRTTYFGGDTPNILDYAIWPWFPRTEVLDVIFGEGNTFSEERFPKLVNEEFLSKILEIFMNDFSSFSLNRTIGTKLWLQVIRLFKSMFIQKMLMSNTSSHVVLAIQITMYWSNKLNLSMQRHF